MRKVTMCDPPSGWRYGFPKPQPDNVKNEQQFVEWLVREGYPRSEIDRMGKHFYCRYWQEEVE